MLVPTRPATSNDAPPIESLQTSMLSDSGPQAPPRRRCQVFPVKVFCCPCLSSNWTIIQDWLHLVLVLGVTASFGCIVGMVLDVGLDGHCDSVICVNRWMAAVCVMPSLFWFILTIRQYDQELNDKKKDRQVEVQNLIETHNRQAEEMNECCKQITENANDFAEGRFNDKAAAFIRFLRNVPRDMDVYSDSEMMEELRNFVIMWFHQFSGTLINPESNPVWANVEKEMRNCTTVQTICDAAMKRVNATKIAFKCQVPADTPLIEGRAGQCESTDSAIGVLDLEAAEKKCGVTWLRFHRCRAATRYLHNRPVTYAEMRQAHQDLDDAQLRAEWRNMRRVEGCGCQRSSNAEGMPFEIMFGCGKLRILSKMHLNFIILFFVDIFLLIFEACNYRWVTFALVLINESCAISVLACFEQINEIAVLDREIFFFRERVAEISTKHEKAQKDWDQVKQLHELWKYRTLPILGVMHKVTDYLEDRVVRTHGDALQDGMENPTEFLRFANQSIDCLDKKLGPLEDWRKRDIPLDEDWKETVGKRLRSCEHGDDLIGTLTKLPIITKDLRDLDAEPPSQSPRQGSFTGAASSSGAAGSRQPRVAGGSFTGSFTGSPAGSFHSPGSSPQPSPKPARPRRNT